MSDINVELGLVLNHMLKTGLVKREASGKRDLFTDGYVYTLTEKGKERAEALKK